MKKKMEINEKQFRALLDLAKPYVIEIIKKYADATKHLELPVIDYNLIDMQLIGDDKIGILFGDNEFNSIIYDFVMEIGKELYPTRFFDFGGLSDEEEQILQDEYGEDYFEKLMNM